ncbi:MAG: hypothetical protein QNJ16_15580 [Rhodobacter sp.]|nr:hypothetical protein [Rhodobacter sp.]
MVDPVQPRAKLPDITGSELRAEIEKRLGADEALSFEPRDIYADPGVQAISLKDLRARNAEIVFDGINFKDPVDMSGSWFAQVRFRDCTFVPSNLKGKSSYSLNLDAILAHEVEIARNASTASGDGSAAFRLVARRCEIDGSFRLIRRSFGHMSGGAQTDFGHEQILMEQARIKNDLMFDDHHRNSPLDGVVMNLHRARIGGDFLVEGYNASGMDSQSGRTRLALNAEDLRVEEELRLRNVNLLRLEGDKLALNLCRARINRFVLGGRPAELWQDKAPLSLDPKYEFDSSEEMHSNEPGLQDIQVRRLGVLDNDQAVGKKLGDFWNAFVGELTFEDTAKDDAEKSSKGRILRTFSSALSGIDDDAADELRIKEKALKDSGKSYLRRLFLRPVYVFVLFGVIASLIYDDFYGTVDLGMRDYIVYSFWALMFAALAFVAVAPEYAGDRVRELFDRVSFDAIKGGLRPLNVLAYVIALWCAATIVFTFAAHKGMIAPDHPDIFHTEFDLLMIQEIADLDKAARGNPGQATGGPQPPTAPAEAEPEDDPTASASDDGQDLEPPDRAAVDRQNELPDLSWWDRNEDTFYANFFQLGAENGGAQLTKDEKKSLRTLPLTAFHSACRLNWAMPTKIPPDQWIKKLSRRSPVTEDGREELPPELVDLLTTKIEKSVVCERFLPAEYSRFMPAIYAADVVIPLLDLRQEQQWSVRVSKPHDGSLNFWAAVIVAFEALAVLIGWIFALVVAGAVTGLSDPTRRPGQRNWTE